MCGVYHFRHDCDGTVRLRAVDTQPTPLSDLHRPSNPSTDVMSPADDNVVLM